jgi:hypothetical protein
MSRVACVASRRGCSGMWVYYGTISGRYTLLVAVVVEAKRSLRRSLLIRCFFFFVVVVVVVVDLCHVTATRGDTNNCSMQLWY